MKTPKKHVDCLSLVLDVTNDSGDNFLKNWDPSHEDNFLMEVRDQPETGSFFNHSLLWEEERPWERGCHCVPRQSPIQVLTRSQQSLTSVLGREPVFYLWYGRRQGNHRKNFLSYKGN